MCCLKFIISRSVWWEDMINTKTLGGNYFYLIPYTNYSLLYYYYDGLTRSKVMTTRYKFKLI